MKKFLFLLILLSGIGNAQTRQNEIYYRGDKTDFSFYYTNGDVTNKRLRFVIKEDFELSSPRLVQKGNALAGGDATQLEASYSDDTTHIIVHLLPTDMDSFEPKKYHYDIVSIDTSDTNNSITIFAGVLNLKSDVQTPYDGIPNGNDYNQWDSFQPGDILIVDTLGGEKILSSAEPGSEAILGYMEYVAIANIQGSVAFEFYVIKNNIATISWNRISVGYYRGTLSSGTYPVNTLPILFSFMTDGGPVWVIGVREDANIYSLSFHLEDTSPIDPYIDFLPITIKMF